MESDETITESCGNVFTDLGLKVCGNCEFHSCEGKDGLGICNGAYAQRTHVKHSCDDWNLRTEE